MQFTHLYLYNYTVLSFLKKYNQILSLRFSQTMNSGFFLSYFWEKITQNQENSPSSLNPNASDKSITVTGNGWIRFEVSYQ